MRTRVCELLGVEHPILNAPMATAAGAELAAAVSNAGGFGLIAGAFRGADALRAEIDRACELTDRPFGVGFISHLPEAAELNAVALEHGVRVVAHSFADPTPFVAPAHDAGALVLCQVRSVDEARVAAAAHVDIVVAQGTEAGGHTGLISTLPLVPAVVDAVAPIPVIAAGGIADARGIAAALVLGADGVWMGTRFLATFETTSQPWIADCVVSAGAGDTVLTDVFDLAVGLVFPPEVHTRTLRNTFTDRWHGHEDELAAWTDDDHAAYFAGGFATQDEGMLLAGEAVGLIDALEPAGDIVRRLADEVAALLRDRPSDLLA